jgi:thiol-disulfide isomerase/thioredoxin
MKISTKVFSLSLIFAFTLVYSVWHKRKIDDLAAKSGELIIRELPKSSVELFSHSLEPVKKPSLASLLEGTNGLVVHFWGTWCAPCEAELPEFVKFSEKIAKDKVKILMLAVNDEPKKMKKFLKRFKKLPANIVIGLDNSGQLMDSFGTVKVPETYLFMKSGKHVEKFVGPQDWEKAFIFSRIRFLLGLE